MSNLAAELKPFEAAARRMQGWHFEYLPEDVGGETPWDYEAQAAARIKDSDAVVDLGTGGGEVFSKLLAATNCDAYATEEWGPNVTVAGNRLKRLAPVTHCSSLQLPFQDNTFNLVLSRHEAINPAEVMRVLRNGGRFLSQQVINDFMVELGDYFPDTQTFPDFFADYQNSFSQFGARIIQAEEFRYKIRFKELGHLVYQIVVAPWTIPDFSVDTHLEGLQILDNKLKQGGELLFSAGYYLLEVENEDSKELYRFMPLRRDKV